MKWQKLGRIFKAEGQRPWMRSHTAMPKALCFQDHVRVFFATRNEENRPRIAHFDFNPESPDTIHNLSEEPVLEPGEWGMFDDNGVYPGNLITLNDEIWLYYMGRSNGVEPVWYMGIGLAVSRDGGNSFERYSKAPVHGRSAVDPWMTASPWIMRLSNSEWRMWYCSGIGWRSLTRKISLYHIRSARSVDGITWKPDPEVAVPLAANETNVAAPTVWRDGGLFHMVYARIPNEHEPYVLGYAVSNDGEIWERRDSGVGIALSESGWDDNSMSYPCVFEFRGKRYMLYSGNIVGREGIGLAILDAE